MSKLTVLVNRNLTMSPGKLAAQAVHAVLYAYGIPHDRVVVLNASKAKLEDTDPEHQVRDLGHTELPAGTLTAAVQAALTPEQLRDAAAAIIRRAEQLEKETS